MIINIFLYIIFIAFITFIIFLIYFNSNDNKQLICSNNCSNNGKCSSNGKCICDEGFGGTDCSDVIPNICPNNCSNKGKCSSNGKCICDDGFGGTDCSDVILNICPNNCSNKGKCVSNGKCICDEGFQGTDCSKIKYNTGDSVTHNGQNGCIINSNDTGLNICYGPIADIGCYNSDYIPLKDVEQIKKINDDIELDCYGENTNCLNKKLGCTTDSGYPGSQKDTKFNSEEDCISYFGINNKWGKCVSFEQPYSNDSWTIGCKNDLDCSSNNINPYSRKCIDDSNPLNPLKKSCSCINKSDCTYTNKLGQFYPTLCNDTTFGGGKILCSSYKQSI